MRLKRASARIIALLVALTLFVSVAAEPVSAAKIKGKTGIGMAEWAFKAYNEGWTYKWGGSSAGKVDCSGLICRVFTDSVCGARDTPESMSARIRTELTWR